MTTEGPPESVHHAKKISSKQGEAFTRPGFTGIEYVNHKDGLGFNVFSVDVTEGNPGKKMEGFTRTYFVTEGTGTFTLDGENHVAEVGDLFVIPEGSDYSYQGKMKLFEFNVNTPSKKAGE